MGMGVQQAIQTPAAGIAVGSSTAAYGWMNDISNIVEFVGMTAGAILSVLLLSQFLIKAWRRRNGD